MVALGPDRPSPPQRPIDATRDTNGEALRTSAKALTIVRLDDEMDVVGLDGVLDEAERALRPTSERGSNRKK
jgi:hypothetical protein